MRTLALTSLLALLFILPLLVLADGVAAAPLTQTTPVDPEQEEAGPLAQALGVVFVFVVAGVAGFLLLRSSKAKSRSATGAVEQASRRSEPEREEAVRRTEKFDARDESFEQIFVYDELDRNFHTYRTAYELIVRGLQVRLYSEPPNADFNFGKKKMRRMDMTKAESFTTESLAPHLMEIASIAQFSKHVPYRRRNRLAIVVHSDDLEEAYELLLDLGIRRVGTQQSTPDAQFGP